MKTKKAKETNSRIAIIGNGKLTKELIQGLLSAGHLPENITIIRREDSSSDFSWFDSHKIVVSVNMQLIADASHILIAVVPKASGDMLDRLSKVTFSEDLKYEIVSFVSGLYRDHIRRHILGTVKYILISGTCNTNIAYKHGVICLDGGSTLFSPLPGEKIPKDGDGRAMLTSKHHTYASACGTVIWGPSDRMHFAVLTTGSAPAIDYTQIQDLYSSTPMSGDYPTFYYWLLVLQNQLNAFSFEDFELYKHIHPHTFRLFEYIGMKARLFSDQRFQYKKDAGKQLAILSVKSCVATLIAIGLEVQPSHIESRLKTIVTEKGCTAEGLSVLSTSSEKPTFELLQQAFYVMLNKAANFKNTVRDSMEDFKVTDSPLCGC
jgi:pyrroline-5-carboxylate reductase